MYRMFQSICPGMPRIVGPACGNYIGPHGPSFTTQQWIIPMTSLPQDKDPKFAKKMAPYIRKLNFPRVKGRRVRVFWPRRAHPATTKSLKLKIGDEVGKPRIPRVLEQSNAFDALEYFPRYLLRAGSGNRPRKLPGAQTRAASEGRKQSPKRTGAYFYGRIGSACEVECVFP